MMISAPAAPRVMAALVGIAVPFLVFGRAATAVSIGYWVSGLFNFSFWSAWWQVSFMVLLALCLSHTRRPGAGSPPPAQGAA